MLTLMSQPFSELHILGTGTQGQEVTPHIQRRVLLLEKVFGSIGIICGEVINSQAVGQRGGVRHGAGSWILRCLCWGFRRVVLVIASPAKPLATGEKEKDGLAIGPVVKVTA